MSLTHFRRGFVYGIRVRTRWSGPSQDPFSASAPRWGTWSSSLDLRATSWDEGQGQGRGKGTAGTQEGEGQAVYGV